MRDIGDLLAETGAVLEWDEFSRTGVLWSDFDSVSFAPGDEVAILDFSRILKIEPIIYNRGKLLIPDPTFVALSKRLERPDRRLRPVTAIVIDAGHGGDDSGAVRPITIDGESVTIREKDIVLDLARRVRSQLAELVDGPAVTLSRDDDIFLELRERVDFAHGLREDPLDNVLFVSIHVNSSIRQWTDARGVEIYYLPGSERRQVLEEEVTATLDPEISSILNDLKEEEYTVESVLMGQYVLESISSRLSETPVERGIRPYSYFVVREARMPSILIETGFINNKEELRLLTTEEYRNRLASAIAHGIAGYVRDFEQVR